MAPTKEGVVKRFPSIHSIPSSRGGYTLVELLTVILIIGILAGALTASYSWLSLSGTPEKEAQKLSRWLTNLTTTANRTGQSFKLSCPGNVRRNYIEVIWQTTSKKDTYTSTYGCVFNRYRETNADSRYSPQWSAMVPTITITVSREDARHYVIVSRHGRVRTNRLPALELAR